MVTVGDLREELVELGMSKEAADLIKGKENLKAEIELVKKEASDDPIAFAISTLEESDPEFCGVEASEDIVVEPEIEIVDPTNFYSQEQILSLFEEDELLDGEYPKANGLRRVANLVIGPIVDESSRTEFINWDAENRISGIKCDFSITFECKNTNFGSTGSAIRFCDSSDCIPQLNCLDPKFSKYPTAIASTRAEARVLRKALRLNIVSAEEMDVRQDDTQITLINKTGDQYIKEAQIKVFRNICENKGIDIETMVTSVNKNASKVEELTEEDFKKAIKELNE